MLSLLRRVFCPGCFSWGTGPYCEGCDERTPVEKWAEKASKLATPDDLIAARIVQSFTKDLETNWRLHTQTHSSTREDWYKRWTKPGTKANYFICNRVLENGTIFIAYYSPDHAILMPCEPPLRHFFVNDVPISDTSGTFIVTSFNKLKERIATAKDAAVKAKQKMEENEAKWDLVEKLFHMRRNEQGALIPIERWPCGRGGLCSHEGCREIKEGEECLQSNG
jgi:hypothetical protein